MRDYTTDEDLNLLARGADSLSFDISNKDCDDFSQRWREGDVRNISPFPDGRSFRVRLSLGGEQRIIGIFSKALHAARYADAARLFFWSCRLRNVRLPDDRDFNFSLLSAQQDLDTNEKLLGHLEQIKQHFLRMGYLKPMHFGKASKGEQRDTRRTARHVLENFLNTTEGTHLKVLEKLDVSQKYAGDCFDQIKRAFQALLNLADEQKRLNEDLRKKVEELEVTVRRKALEPEPAPHYPGLPLPWQPSHPEYPGLPGLPCPGPGLPYPDMPTCPWPHPWPPSASPWPPGTFPPGTIVSCSDQPPLDNKPGTSEGLIV